MNPTSAAVRAAKGGDLLDVVVFDDLVDLFLAYLFHAKHGQSMKDNVLILRGIFLQK